MPDSIGPYAVVREIGRGGMGIVYEGWDARLSRAVAIKTIIRSADPLMRDRFLREARAAAAVNHPYICQLFDIGEHEGNPFLCMELLEGRSLADRLADGPLTVTEAAATELAILSALSALHRRGIVHRDLKPTNVFLTADGIKLLDFGLARSSALDLDETALTLPGVVMGSPRYMAPEQVRGGVVDGRTDIFAAGLVLFEMLSGQAAFTGTDAVDVLHAVVHEHPPALMGSPAVAELDRIIQRAVAKLPGDRYQSADDMAADVRACVSRADAGDVVRARASTRLVVLPFKVLRPDPEIDFLAYSLPDAITVSLSPLESLTVRAPLAAARFGDGSPDLRQLASELNVDAAISGTLLRAGSSLRLALQLFDVPSGTVRWSHGAQVTTDDLFAIQDSVCSAVVDALALPLSARERAVLRHDVPASAEAYELYLRANRLSTAGQWTTARDLYTRAVELDPAYAPAWARLGRVLRVIGKYGLDDEPHAQLVRAEEAFRRAFALNPDLPLLHNLYTYREVESGRAHDAVIRLLGRLRTRTNDPDLFAGLVHACRYVGLLDASVASYHRATRLDPSIATSAAHTFFMLGQFERAIALDPDGLPYVSMLAYLALDQREDAAALSRASRGSASAAHLTLMHQTIEAALDGRLHESGALLREMTGTASMPAFTDSEGWFYWAQIAAYCRDAEFALTLLGQAVASGFHCPRALETSPLLDPLRGWPEFASLLGRAQQGHQAALQAFTAADGHRLLGV
jgi:eukaryotic-like serine/threonine-protein kinase